MFVRFGGPRSSSETPLPGPRIDPEGLGTRSPGHPEHFLDRRNMGLFGLRIRAALGPKITDFRGLKDPRRLQNPSKMVSAKRPTNSDKL